MKTEVLNGIHFQDGKDINFINLFKKIFPKEGYYFNLYHFEMEQKGHGVYDLILDIDVTPHDSIDNYRFTYTKKTFDMTVIDSIKMDPTGSITRKRILELVGNDTFIEELDEFLESIKINN